MKKAKTGRAKRKNAGGGGKIRLSLSLAANVLILAFTAYSMFLCFFEPSTGEFTADGVRSFRYFTVDSNLFCALASLVLIFADIRLLSKNGGWLPRWVVLLKFAGTVTVTLTLLTCVVYLSGFTGGFLNMIRGKELFMHLLTPVLAILSLVLLEHSAALPLWTIFLSVPPVAAYGAVYFYKVLLVPKDRGGWTDFYKLAGNGKWLNGVLVMFAAVLLISLVLWALHSLFGRIGRK